MYSASLFTSMTSPGIPRLLSIISTLPFRAADVRAHLEADAFNSDEIVYALFLLFPSGVVESYSGASSYLALRNSLCNFGRETAAEVTSVKIFETLFLSNHHFKKEEKILLLLTGWIEDIPRILCDRQPQCRVYWYSRMMDRHQKTILQMMHQCLPASSCNLFISGMSNQ